MSSIVLFFSTVKSKIITSVYFFSTFADIYYIMKSDGGKSYGRQRVKRTSKNPLDTVQK